MVEPPHNQLGASRAARAARAGRAGRAGRAVSLEIFVNENKLSSAEPGPSLAGVLAQAKLYYLYLLYIVKD